MLFISWPLFGALPSTHRWLEVRVIKAVWLWSTLKDPHRRCGEPGPCRETRAISKFTPSRDQPSAHAFWPLFGALWGSPTRFEVGVTTQPELQVTSVWFGAHTQALPRHRLEEGEAERRRGLIPDDEGL